MPDFLVQEDGTSKLLLEDGSGALLLDERPTVLTHFASLGCANEYDFGKYTLELSPSSDVPAGDLVVIWATWTSHYFFGPIGAEVPEMSCTDDAGNQWLQLVDSYVNEAYVAMYVSQVRNGLATTDTVTLKHYGPGAKAACMEQFTLDPSKRWAFDLDSLSRVGIRAGDPQSISISGLDVNREYLLLHVLGVQGPDTDTYTWDSDYTPITGTGTTGHGAVGGGPPSVEDVHVRGGWRIVSGISSDTVDVTAAIPTRDNDQALLALFQIDVDDDFPDFPNTPLLDDFNRANEDPNDAGIWQTVSPRPGFGTAFTRTVSNQAAMSTSGSGSGSQYLLAAVATYEDDIGEYEEWGTLAVAGDLVLSLGTGSGQAADVGATGVGYRDSGMRAFNAAAVAMGLVAFGDIAFTGDLPTGKNGIVWGPLANGTKLGIQQLTVDVWTQHLWIDDGAGWEWVAAITRGYAHSFISGGQWGIGFEGDTATRLDDLGGGPLEREAPRIIRRLATDGHSFL